MKKRQFCKRLFGPLLGFKFLFLRTAVHAMFLSRVINIRMISDAVSIFPARRAGGGNKKAALFF